MRVLIGCEYSGVVRDAFAARGHTAVSCDLLPTDRPHGWHVQGDLLSILDADWDLAIFHPPCTHLAVSGARHFAAKKESGVQQEALAFVRRLMAAPIGRMALENPVSIISSQIRKPDQVIQPWQYGHGETKATCLWLKGLPKLTPTNIVDGREARVHKLPPTADRRPLEAAKHDAAGYCRSHGRPVGRIPHPSRLTSGFFTPGNKGVPAMNSELHPVFQQLLKPFAPQMTETEAIAADLHNNTNKAARAHQAQERNAFRLQQRQYTGDFS